ncbi:MAG: hypothetical protein U9Q18_06905 [Caldisericota bacterium]|nr:hypothetical protein [Caldisericota bacterium]
MYRKRKLVLIILIIIVVLFVQVYISYLETTKRNPYFDHLLQSEKNVILSATPTDVAKLYFESLHEKNFELNRALLSERLFWRCVWSDIHHPPILESLLFKLSPKYRSAYAKLVFSFVNLEEISEIDAGDITNEPLIGATGKPIPYMIGVSFVLKKGTFGCTAPPDCNITRFVHVSKSSLYKCFLIDGIGTSP